MGRDGEAHQKGDSEMSNIIVDSEMKSLISQKVIADRRERISQCHQRIEWAAKDIAEAEYLLMAQNANIGVAVAKMFPSISLTGMLGIASSDLSTLTDGAAAWSIGGSLLGPLFNFNKNTLRVEIEEARTEQALYNYENTVLIAFREVEDALIEVETYKRQIAANRRQFNAAKNAEYLSQQRYDQGVTSYLEVLDAQRSSFNAALELSEVNKDYLNAYVKLYKALGGGWITQEEMQEAEKQAEMDDGLLNNDDESGN